MKNVFKPMNLIIAALAIIAIFSFFSFVLPSNSKTLPNGYSSSISSYSVMPTRTGDGKVYQAMVISNDGHGWIINIDHPQSGNSTVGIVSHFTLY